MKKLALLTTGLLLIGSPALATNGPAATALRPALTAMPAALATNRPGLAPQVEQDNTLPRAFEGVDIEQRLGQSLPLDATFRDEQGNLLPLRELFNDERPAVLVLAYYECPMLCTQVLNNLVRDLKLVPLTVGKDFRVIVVSFAPDETPELAAAKKANYLEQYRRPGSEQGWHFLTGDEEPIRRLTDAVGFRYRWDQASQQYVHPSGVTVITPDGTISKYFYGIQYRPSDLRLALLDAAGGKVGTMADRLLLYCFDYHASSGRYTLAVMRLLKIAGVLTLAGIGTLLLVLIRRDRTAAPVAPGSSEQAASDELPPR